MFAFAGAAQAAVIVSFAPGAASPPPGFTVIYNFDTTTPASLVPGPLVQIKSPPSDGNGAPPANSVPAGTKYLSVLGGGLATISFLSPQAVFSFDWGSIDSYNTLTLLTNGGPDVIIPGTDFITPANGNQLSPGTNGLFTATGTGGTLFSGFTLGSSANSFEIDNVAVRSPVPEPATWAMMVFGFGALGGAMRRRGRKSVRARINFA